MSLMATMINTTGTTLPAHPHGDRFLAAEVHLNVQRTGPALLHALL